MMEDYHGRRNVRDLWYELKRGYLVTYMGVSLITISVAIVCLLILSIYIVFAVGVGEFFLVLLVVGILALIGLYLWKVPFYGAFYENRTRLLIHGVLVSIGSVLSALQLITGLVKGYDSSFNFNGNEQNKIIDKTTLLVLVGAYSVVYSTGFIIELIAIFGMTKVLRANPVSVSFSHMN